MAIAKQFWFFIGIHDNKKKTTGKISTDYTWRKFKPTGHGEN